MPHRTILYKKCSMILLSLKTKMVHRTLNHAKTIGFSELFEPLLSHNSNLRFYSSLFHKY